MIKVKPIFLASVLTLCVIFLADDQALGQIRRGRRQYLPQEQIHSVNIRYGDGKEIPSLPQTVGPTMQIAPFSDGRSGRQYIGHQTIRTITNYFKSEPFPLQKAIREFFSDGLSHSGVQTTFVSSWDGRPEALSLLEADSILRIHIKRFWIGARTSGSKTILNASVYLVCNLGVKKEGRVFTRSVYIGKEIVVNNFTPESVGEIVHRILLDAFEDFFSEPYESLPE